MEEKIIGSRQESDVSDDDDEQDDDDYDNFTPMKAFNDVCCIGNELGGNRELWYRCTRGARIMHQC